MSEPTKNCVTVELTQMAEIKLPSLPNFIRLTADDRAIDVADLDSKTIHAIGEEWLDALHKHAAKRRSERKQINQ